MHEARFCPRCGTALVEGVPPLDSRRRRLCPACGYVCYVNPKIATGTVPVRDGRIALIRRGIEPALGLWSFPCGYVEHDETLEEAAVRETHEESGLVVALGPMLGAYSYPGRVGDGMVNPSGIVVVAWSVTTVTGDLRAGDDAQDAAWFRPDEIPWESLAFDSSKRGLRDALRRLDAQPPR